jgi:PAS domain S-box-containing protein
MRHLLRQFHLPRHFYLLMAIALISLIAASIGIANGMSRILAAGQQVELGYRRIAATQAIMAIARDEETGQRGFVLTGQERFLQPYLVARPRATLAWANLEQLPSSPQFRTYLKQMRQTFDEKSALNDRSIELARTSGISAGQRFVEKGEGQEKMEQLRRQSEAFIERDKMLLVQLKQDSEDAYRDAIIQAIIASLAFLGAGALFSSAVQKARVAAGQSAAKAAAADQRFQATFDQAGAGMMLLSPDGLPIMTNAAMCEMTGFSRSEFLSAKPSSPAHPAQLFGDNKLRQQFATGQVKNFRGENWTKAKNGSAICLQILISHVSTPEGETAFHPALVLDVTNRRRVEDSFIESQTHLRTAQAELAHIGRVNDLGEMAAAIAHEVNQPLTAIVNYLSAGQHMLAALPCDTGEIPNLMRRVSEQALRAGQIIQRMRSFVDRGKHVHQSEELDPLIESAIDLSRLGFAPSQVNIQYKPGAGNPMLHVDAIQIQQIIIILIRNAVEAFRSAGDLEKMLQIEVQSTLDEALNMVSIYVSDNGPGISAEEAGHIFQPFFSSKKGNLGMGLSIAKRLVEDHGGSLSLVAQDAGATFRLQLPITSRPTRKRAKPKT